MVWRQMKEIANAILTGFGGKGHIAPVATEKVYVYVEGHDEPIEVVRDDVILPEWAEPAAGGIMLDVQAILAS